MIARDVQHRDSGFAKRTHCLDMLAVLFILVLCPLLLVPAKSLAGSATVFVEGVPGGVIVNTTEAVLKVIDIDHEKRVATLQDADGKTLTAKAGPQAVNFDQVRAGDMVRMTLSEELVVFLDEEGAAPKDSSSGAMVTAPKGAQPGGLLVSTRQVTGTVSAINQENRTVSLQFSNGVTRTFPVRKDIDLTKRKLGDQVVFRFTETLAIDVEKL